MALTVLLVAGTLLIGISTDDLGVVLGFTVRGGREGGREGGRKGGREEEKEGEREGGRGVLRCTHTDKGWEEVGH